MPNDSLSGVRVPPGCTVVLFEHGNFQGASKTLTADDPCLAHSHPAGFNDATSSFKITCAAGARPSG